MNNEFMANMFIDTIQNSKTEFVKTWFKDDNTSKPLNDFIKLQTEFTKEAMKTVFAFQSATGENLAKGDKQ